MKDFVGKIRAGSSAVFLLLWSLCSSADLRLHSRYQYIEIPVNGLFSFWEGPCASSWAVSVAMAALLELDAGVGSSWPSPNYIISYQYMMDCCAACSEGYQNGCHGGDFVKAMDWMTTNGSYSGGTNNLTGYYACKNYARAECTMNYTYSQRTGMAMCTDADLIQDNMIKVCNNKCNDGTTAAGPYKLTGGKSTVTRTTDYHIDMANFQNGPSARILITEAIVYEDLLAWSDPEAVYYHSWGRAVGTVTVLLFGNLIEPTTSQDYWIVWFPWGHQFGKRSFLKVAKGVNMLGLEMPGKVYYFL